MKNATQLTIKFDNLEEVLVVEGLLPQRIIEKIVEYRSYYPNSRGFYGIDDTMRAIRLRLQSEGFKIMDLDEVMIENPKREEY